MIKKLSIIVLVAFFALVPAVFAKDASPLAVREVRQTVQGVDRVFSFTIENTLNRVANVRGRVVVINVYDTSLPLTLPVENIRVPARSTSNVTVRWHDAPIVGQIRASIILDEGEESSLVASYVFWLLPNVKVVVSLGALLVLALALTMFAFRFARRPRISRKNSNPSLGVDKPKKGVTHPAPPKQHVPANMLAYHIEPDDTVMSLSARFDVTWQDLVHANRLTPPYALQPGKTLLIPRHPLKSKPPTPKG